MCVGSNLPVPESCPSCRQRILPSEWYAYAKCENCYVQPLPTLKPRSIVVEGRWIRLGKDRFLAQ